MSDMPQLERALVEAARRRARRRFDLPFPIRRLGVAFAAAAVVAALVLVLRSAGGGDEHAATPPPAPAPVDLQELVGRTFSQAQAEPSCRISKRRSRMVDAPASAATLDAFGVLRRPARPDDRYPRPGGAYGGGDVLAGTVRRLEAADGTPYAIAISHGPFAAQMRDREACRARRHAIFDELAADASASADEIRRGRELLDEGLPPDGSERAGHEYLELVLLNPDGTPNDGATVPAADAARHGLLRPSARGDGSGEIERALGGVVPDGVAVVELTWSGGEAQAPVRGNAVRVVLPAGAPREVELVWRDADGSEIRRQRFRFEF